MRYATSFMSKFGQILAKDSAEKRGLSTEINDKVDFRGVLFAFSNLFVIFAVNFGI